MTTLTTHDTKRSEDTRARLAVLAEIAGDFADAVRRVVGRVRPRRAVAEPARLADAGRRGADQRRAARRLPAEGGPGGQAAHDVDRARRGLRAADPAVAGPGPRRPSAPRSTPSSTRIAAPGWSNSLSQKLIQLTAPGRPRRLPGHRAVGLLAGRPRQPAAGRLRRCAASCWRRSTDGLLPEVDATGAAKLLLVHRALTLRRDRPELFGGYRALAARGSGRRSRRRLHAQRGPGRARDPAAAGPGRPRRLGRHARRPCREGQWTDALTGTTVSGPVVTMSSVLDRYPVALLVRDG